MFFDVMDTKPDVGDAPDAVAVGRLIGPVQFEDVSFAYDKGREALADVALWRWPADDRARRRRPDQDKSTTLNLLPVGYRTNPEPGRRSTGMTSAR